MLKGDLIFREVVSLAMNISSFSPLSASVYSDTLCQLFFRLARISFWTTLLLIPLLFIPTVAATLGVIKVYVILVGALLSVIFVSLATLRSGRVQWCFSPVVISWLVVVGSAILSGLLSPQIRNSFLGDVMDIFTVGFLVILGLVLFLFIVLVGGKKQAQLAGVLLFSLLLFANLYQAVVILVGGAIGGFALPSLSVAVVGPIADVAITSGLLILVTLTLLLQMRLTWLRFCLAAVTVLVSLFNLVIVNLSFLWLIVAGFSLVLLLYALVKDLFLTAAERTYRPKETFRNLAVGVVTTVFLTATLILFLGGSISDRLAARTGVSYMDVSPSLVSTINIGREVFRDNAFTGSGPNTFVQNWRLHKSEEINRTVFWNTPFFAGSSYILTWFVTTGLIGALAWLAFLGSVVYVGVRTLLTVKEPDSFWFTTGTISLVAAVYLWAVLLWTNTGIVPIVLAIIATAMVVVAERMLGLIDTKQLTVVGNRRLGFAMTGVVLVVILLTLSFGYTATRQVMAAHNFVTLPSKLGDSNDLSLWEQGFRQSYQMFTSDIYIREIMGLYQLRLGQLLATENPTENDQEEFIGLLTETITVGEYLVTANPREPQNWVLLADTYAALVSMEVEGAAERAVENYQRAKQLDPVNPQYDLLLAQVSASAGDTEGARALIENSLKLKPNYTDALNFSAQLELNSGDIAGAIARTETLLTIEPNNAGRFYQLGVLHVANQNSDAAITAFDKALALDPQYANAKYVRALQYFERGDNERAISELREVMDLSSDNAFLEELIVQIERGEVTAADLRNTSVSEQVPTGVGVPPAVDLPEDLEVGNSDSSGGGVENEDVESVVE